MFNFGVTEIDGDYEGLRARPNGRLGSARGRMAVRRPGREAGRSLAGGSFPGGEAFRGGGRGRDISDTYFDTGDWRIYRAGYALRVRSKKEGAAEATMKLLAPAADGAPGLRRRREISEPLDGAKPTDLDGASGPVGEKIRALVGSRALRPIFEVRTSRSAHALSLNGAEVGEVALDETTIPLGKAKSPPCCGASR